MSFFKKTHKTQKNNEPRTIDELVKVIDLEMVVKGQFAYLNTKPGFHILDMNNIKSITINQYNESKEWLVTIVDNTNDTANCIHNITFNDLNHFTIEETKILSIYVKVHLCDIYVKYAKLVMI
jgi:hypothetical protein